jgi:ParB family chromosome partitioning protein
LSLPLKVLKLIENKKISPGHAKILVGLPNAEFVANKIITKNLSVRQAENFVKIFKTKKQSFKTYTDVNLRALESLIIEKIGLNVMIKNKKNNTGSLIVDYKDLDQLNKIIEVIKSHY